MKKYADYIGVPYADKGRDMAGADCLGLVMLISKNVFNKPLPESDYKYRSSSDLGTTSACYSDNKDLFRRCSEPRVGCLIMFCVLGCAGHCGIYVGDNLFLHTLSGHNSALERLDSITWNRRVEGFYEF